MELCLHQLMNRLESKNVRSNEHMNYGRKKDEFYFDQTFMYSAHGKRTSNMDKKLQRKSIFNLKMIHCRMRHLNKIL
jgi:hypothetical protein